MSPRRLTPLSESARCDYRIAARVGERQCENKEKWVVTYLSPDNGSMRHRVTTCRCEQHIGEKFFPDGATQIALRGRVGMVPDGKLRARAR